MFWSTQGLEARSRILAAAAAAATAVGLTACAASGGAPAATPATTVTQAAQASQAPAAGNPPAASSAPSSGSADTSAGELPDYQPSTVVSKSAYSVVLTSPDSVGKIGEFYRNALAVGGWRVTSSSMSAYHASLVAYRSNEGVSVSVYSRGSGSGISISTHPR